MFIVIDEATSSPAERIVRVNRMAHFLYCFMVFHAFSSHILHYVFFVRSLSFVDDTQIIVSNK